jgi:hypothetical protein
MNGERKAKGIRKSASKDSSDQSEGSNRSKSYATKNGYGICYPTQEGRSRQTDTLTKINISYRSRENSDFKIPLISIRYMILIG